MTHSLISNVMQILQGAICTSPVALCPLDIQVYGWGSPILALHLQGKWPQWRTVQQEDKGKNERSCFPCIDFFFLIASNCWPQVLAQDESFQGHHMDGAFGGQWLPRESVWKLIFLEAVFYKPISYLTFSMSSSSFDLMITHKSAETLILILFFKNLALKLAVVSTI